MPENSELHGFIQFTAITRFAADWEKARHALSLSGFDPKVCVVTYLGAGIASGSISFCAIMMVRSDLSDAAAFDLIWSADRSSILAFRQPYEIWDDPDVEMACRGIREGGWNDFNVALGSYVQQGGKL